MKDLLEHIVKALVDHPADLRIAEMGGDKTVIFEMRCHPDDVGKIIGKGGKTVGAIRVLLTTVAMRSGKRALLEVVE
jgi:hypothetical protein